MPSLFAIPDGRRGVAAFVYGVIFALAHISSTRNRGQ